MLGTHWLKREEFLASDQNLLTQY